MTQSTGIESDPSVSVDGARLAYSVGDPGSGGVIADLATGHQTAFGKMRVILQASIAPDCDRMVFVSQRWDKRGELAEQVLVDGVPSGSPRRLTDQEGTASHPVYSPDGKWIAYYLILDGELDIWIVPSEGGRPVRFTDHPEHDVHPAWSPDGSELVFASRREGPYGVWVAPVDDGKPAGEARRLTDGSAVAFAPVWSPDGTEIAFVGASEGGLDVWLLPADGSEPATRLTDGVDATRIRWEGTGERILMAATCGANRRSLWTVSLETGAVAPFETEILFGSAMYPGLFDLSRDGRLLVFARESLEGDVWISDGRPGLF